MKRSIVAAGVTAALLVGLPLQAAGATESSPAPEASASPDASPEATSSAAPEASADPSPSGSPSPSPSASPAGAPHVSSVTPSGDEAEVVVLAPARTEPTEYWLEHGTTTSYGEQTTRQRLDAGPAQELRVRLVGLVRGDHHVRPLALGESGTEPTVGGDARFFTSGISFLLTSTRPTGDGAYLLTAISAREQATEYWIEYGSTTSYGQRTAAQTVPAGSSQDELLFHVTGLAPGSYHARPVARSVGAPAPDLGDDVTFTTSSTTGAPWPTCTDAQSTQCVRSFTVDGAPASGIAHEVFLAGGGLNVHAISPRGDQELLYAGSPVTAASTIEIVVDAGSYDPDLLLANGRVSTARIDRSGGRNVITFAARPERTSFTTAGCRIGACGDDTTRGDDDYAGRWTVAAFPLLNNDPAYVAAARQGMWLSSNAQSRSTPGFDAQTRTLRMSLAAPHLTETGELNTGTFQGLVPDAMFRDVWKISGPEDVVASAASDGADQGVTSTWTRAEGGWLLTLSGLHYSSPVVALTPRPGAPAPSASASPAPAPATSAPAHRVPQVQVAPFVVRYGQPAYVTITGTPGATVDLYIRKYRADFVKIRDGLVLDGSGRTTVATRPDMNLRFLARDRTLSTPSSTAGTDGLMTVEKNVSLNVARVGVGRFTFSGSINPTHPGAVVHLYRNGVLLKASIPVDAARVYRWTGVLPPGTATYRVTSPTTGYNNVSHSPSRSLRTS